MHKTWTKPLHKRRVWQQFSTATKTIYYMQPLMEHIFDIWMQPLPFPTILKFMYTSAVGFFLLLPIIYPFLVLLFYFGLTQFLLERHLNLEFPRKYDLLGTIYRVIFFRITNKKYLIFVAMYMDRYRVILTAISSTIDYMRIALCLIFG